MGHCVRDLLHFTELHAFFALLRQGATVDVLLHGLEAVRVLAGHATLEMTQRYAHRPSGRRPEAAPLGRGPSSGRRANWWATLPLPTVLVP